MHKINRFLFGKDTKISGLFALGIIILIVSGCFCKGTKGTSPPEFVGAWKASDGTTLTIRNDGTGDYKSGGTEVNGGAVEVKDGELSVAFYGIGKTFKIDEPPQNGQMKLDGMIFRKDGGDFADFNDADKKDKPLITKGSDDKDNSNFSIANTDNDKKDNDWSSGNNDVENETLVKNTISDFIDSIEEGDFSSFHAKTSKGFQAAYSPEVMNTRFSKFITDRAQIVPVMRSAVMKDIIFTEQKDSREGGRRVKTLNGMFQHSPDTVRFETRFMEEAGDWKIINIGVFLNK